MHCDPVRRGEPARSHLLLPQTLVSGSREVVLGATAGWGTLMPTGPREDRFELILPFLEPIRRLIEDEAISEIMVNGGRRVFIEQDGVLQEVPGIVIEERQLLTGLKIIARSLGDEISEEKPILDSRLPDGSRVAAVLPPCSVTASR